MMAQSTDGLRPPSADAHLPFLQALIAIGLALVGLVAVIVNPATIVAPVTFAASGGAGAMAWRSAAHQLGHMQAGLIDVDDRGLANLGHIIGLVVMVGGSIAGVLSLATSAV